MSPLAPQAPAGPRSPAPASTPDSVVDLAALPADGELVLVAPAAARRTDAAALLVSIPVVVPTWIRCSYYAPFQRHAINPDLDLWPEGYNQCHPLPVRSLHDLKRGGLFTVFQLEDGDYLALLPLVGHRSAAWLRGDGEGLRLDAGTFGSDPVFRDELPLLAAVRDSDLYRACSRVWAAALAHPALAGVGRLRHEKTYPEVFDYLGWCSFEEFKLAIDEQIIVDAIRRLAASDIPVRWVLVDDGHIDDGTRASASTLETQEGAVGQVSGALEARRLHAATPHPEKFPRGWKPVTEAVVGTRIRWLGLWLNFNGYWGGVSANHALGAELDSHLVRVTADMKLPGERTADGEAFFDALTRPAREAGFDFLKVDNQAGNLRKYAGRVPNAVRAAAACKQGLDTAVRRHFDGIIGCMAHNNLCAFHQPTAQVMRCSEDYKKEDAWRARHHLHNSFGNMLWLGQTVWGDHDMFHSSDRVAGPLMARSKAISGGPIYLSDAPDRFVPELIRPLCFSDGRILRPLAPAVPLPESVFTDPYEDDNAYRVIAPLPHGCAAAAAYNLTHPAKPVHGAWTADDHRHAAALLSDSEAAVWSRPAEALLRYDCLTGRAELQRAEAAPFSLQPLTDAFVIFSPVQDGWALIGDPQKYLPPSAVAVFDIVGDRVRIASHEACDVLVWRASGVVHASIHVSPVGGGLWRAALPGGGAIVELHAAASSKPRPLNT
jgi:Raffinose synthase or seed inhibition protein Sip1.